MRTPMFVPVFVLSALTMALSACSTPQEPKYPIYMEERPVTAIPEQSAPPPVTPYKPESTGIQPLGTQGGVSTSELPPPPPPPPPADSSAHGAQTRPAVAPVRPATAPVKDSAAGYVYTLQAKDTLFGVSRRFGVPVQTLYQMNGLTAQSVTRIGQKVLLPETAKDKGAEAYASGPAAEKVKKVIAQADTVRPAPKPEPVKPSTVESKPVVTPPAKVAEVKTPEQVTEKKDEKPAEKPSVKAVATDTSGIVRLGKGRFIWPYRGNILVRYGQLATNVRNDGINIGGPEGADVVAADEGTVVYVGDQVKELGNTVYIKHADGFYTGYSHLGKVSVKANQKVSLGQSLGTLGKSGAVDRAQLHFEIRYTPSSEIAKPFDPTLVLP